MIAQGTEIVVQDGDMTNLGDFQGAEMHEKRERVCVWVYDYVKTDQLESIVGTRTRLPAWSPNSKASKKNVSQAGGRRSRTSP